MAGNFFNPGARLVQGVVSGGFHGDKSKGLDPQHQSRQAVFTFGESSPGEVNLEDMWLSTLGQSPTNQSQQGFPGALDPGTMVYILKQQGEPGGVIMGMANTLRKKGGGTGGGSGSDLMGSDVIQQLVSHKIGVNIPPQVKEQIDEEVRVRKPEEKGIEHSFDLLDGLPVHGALFNMTGFKWPELKKIPTARQTNTNMMTDDMMNSLMGQVMSMSQMFQGLMNNGAAGASAARGNAPISNAGGTGTTLASTNVDLSRQGGGLAGGVSYMQDIHNGIDNNLSHDQEQAENVKAALNSLSTLVQGLDTSDGVSFVTGGVVHYNTFLENAANLLSQATNVSDIMSAMERLQSDSTMWGLDQLEPAQFSIDTIYGTLTQNLYYDGTIELALGANSTNIINDWSHVITSPEESPAVGFRQIIANTSNANTSTTTSPGGSPSSGGGSGSGSGAGSAFQNMFGQSAKIMKDMFSRLAPEQEKEAKSMHEKLNTSETAKKLNEITKSTVEGGDPLTTENYQETVGNDQFSLSYGP